MSLSLIGLVSFCDAPLQYALPGGRDTASCWQLIAEVLLLVGCSVGLGRPEWQQGDVALGQTQCANLYMSTETVTLKCDRSMTLCSPAYCTSQLKNAAERASWQMDAAQVT